jgi:hypothetical protein
MFVVKFITRAHSSGYKNITKKKFSNIEDASKYMMDIFQDYAIMDGIDGDLYVDRSLKEPAPKPTMELAAKLFNSDALIAFLNDKNKISHVIYDPYSEFCCLVPFEMSIYREN